MSDPPAFFSALDQFQQNAFRRLRSRYPEPGNDSFCKLVALKAANAFTADYHFRNRDSALASRPLQLQIDPTNACHLRCPSCLHSANADWASRFDWPSATLGVEAFDDFCREFGPFAINIALFRDGEPLLHRRFPEFVKPAKSHLLYTLTSTSLSMRLDAESLVASGLDRLVAAIDGASVATYSRYRRGGDFDLVIENLRAMVRARAAQSSRKPWLVWQFLAFEHNAHEVEAAAKLARQIGIDQLVIAKPNSVEHDDPSIKVAETAPFGSTLFSEPYNWCGAAERASLNRNADRIDSVFGESWADRYNAVGGGQREPSAAKSTCNWLYYSLTMDAARRITPCCLPPMGAPEPRHLVYAKFNGENTGEVVNSSDAMLARRQCRRGRRPDGSVAGPSPYCLSCEENPVPPMSPDVARYLQSVDERRALPESVQVALAACSLFA
ncbi:MAG: radical SAM protein [Acidobacteriia bacterium]|nr:radical SAM protein [Terriglobia bacterium]